MQGESRGLVGGRRGHQPSPSPAAVRVPARVLGGEFAIGSAVFAPKRRRAGALHYALAEVTGVQACAGTATVAFAGAEPGVDDEAVPLYALVPCPRPARASGDGGARGVSLRSLAECGLHAEARSGPASPLAAHVRQISCGSVVGGDGAPPPSDAAAPPMERRAPAPSSPSSSVERESDGEWCRLRVAHAPPESVDVFFARAFRAVCRAVLRRPGGGRLAGSRQVALCAFDAYSTLHRFSVYMALRGHRLHLVDGVCPRAAPDAVEDVSWLCLLAEDVEGEGAAAKLLGGWLSPGWPKAAGEAPAAALVVVRFAEVCGDAGCEDRNAESAPRDGEDAVVRRLLGVVGGAGAFVVCRLFLGGGDGELMATSLAAACRHRPQQPDWQGAAVARRRRQEESPVELRVPASRWQLDLLRSLAARDKSTERGGAGGPPPCAAPLPPHLLQSVAYGNVFDASLAAALAAAPGGRELLDGVRDRVVRGGDFVGGDAFPVLAAARAVLADVLAAPSAEPAARQRRVALCLPGAGGATDDAAAYLHAVQSFLRPWHLFTLSAEKRRRQPSVAALLDSRAWLEAGGVLLLSPEDPLCGLSSLHDEADVAITCGKAAAALVAGCRRGVSHIALHSEVELAECPTQRWTLWRGPAEEAERSDAERAVLAAAVAVGGAGAAPVIATAAALLQRLTPPAAGEEEPARTAGGKRLREKGAASEWAHLRRIAEAVALCGCRNPVELFGETDP
ncbi:trans-sialidase [Trypanosoma conorhini]|uniref:Trans-sialidase n=1 Tax=Trypanosoma conorhini TaxID=83891 RepID=A0A422N725_9TRYP|nr:trans-sialidase [Trypanosoma conorhini]RNF01278.1 trans-sialidase [Trypanosoma conorhini]